MCTVKETEEQLRCVRSARLPSKHGSPDARRQSPAPHRRTGTYHEGVEWFKSLGYAVEPGPGLNEVTLINDQRPDFIAHIVVPAERLAGMADLSRTVTFRRLFRPIAPSRGNRA